MQGGGNPDVLPLTLTPGDWLVMASDGVAGGEDGWLTEALTAWEGESPRLLARDLLEGAAARNTPDDDRTVVALRFTAREKEG
jgi:stage II sporulation protein E